VSKRERSPADARSIKPCLVRRRGNRPSSTPSISWPGRSPDSSMALAARGISVQMTRPSVWIMTPVDTSLQASCHIFSSASYQPCVCKQTMDACVGLDRLQSSVDSKMVQHAQTNSICKVAQSSQRPCLGSKAGLGSETDHCLRICGCGFLASHFLRKRLQLNWGI